MVPVSCCTKNSNGKYVNLYNCQRNVAGPPGLIRLNATQASNPGLHFKVNNNNSCYFSISCIVISPILMFASRVSYVPLK